MNTAEPCKACEGSGLVYPTAFLELVAWPYALRIAAESYRKGAPWGSSYLLTGLIGPVPCPECGGVETVPPPVVVCFERERQESPV